MEIRALIAGWDDFEEEWWLVVDFLKTPCHGDVTVRARQINSTVIVSAHATRAAGCTDADLYLEGDGGFAHPVLRKGMTVRGLQPSGPPLQMVIAGDRAEVCSTRAFAGC